MKIVLGAIPELAAMVLTPDQTERLASLGSFDTEPSISDPGSSEGRNALAEADVILGHWGCPLLDDEFLARAPRLRLLAYGAGSVKATVTEATFERGIVVTSAASANAGPVADYTLAAILLANKGAFLRRELTRSPDLDAAKWQIVDPPGNRGKRIGIVGASFVGRAVIERLRPFDFEIAVYDPFLAEEEAARLGVAKISLEELVSTCEVVSLHVPALAETHNMMGAAQFEAMGDGACFINTARGWSVDHDALLAELQTGRIRAVLDVTDPEPLPPDSPFYGLPNVFITPHVSGSLGTEIPAMTELAVQEIERFAAGEAPLHPVTAEDLGRIA